jgi:large subunit ribosomal protein L18e
MAEKVNISKTKIKSRIVRKTNPALASLIALALKMPGWLKFARILSMPSRLHSSVNLSEIDSETKLGDTVLVPGKVLSGGEVTKKIRICSLTISREAFEKLKKTKSEWCEIADEIKRNPRADALKLIK